MSVIHRFMNRKCLQESFRSNTVFGEHICPILRLLVPLFWISGDVSSGFQSQSGFCLICMFYRGKCNVHSLASTSGTTPAGLWTTSITASHAPHASAEVGLGSDLNGQPPAQKTNSLPLCQQPDLCPTLVFKVYIKEWFWPFSVKYHLMSSKTLSIWLEVNSTVQEVTKVLITNITQLPPSALY